jgi:hypothetical protein
MTFETKDSGERRQFDTWAQRDDSSQKSRIDLISPFALDRLGQLMRRWAEKYDERNWEKGMPYSVYLASACRHLNQFMQWDEVEDHLAWVLFNLMAIMHFQQLDRHDLNDLPTYNLNE